MWAFIHVLYLIGWGNRLGTLYTGPALWFTHNRAHRTITLDQASDEMTRKAGRLRGAAGRTAASCTRGSHDERAAHLVGAPPAGMSTGPRITRQSAGWPRRCGGRTRAGW